MVTLYQSVCSTMCCYYPLPRGCSSSARSTPAATVDAKAREYPRLPSRPRVPHTDRSASGTSANRVTWRYVSPLLTFTYLYLPV